MGVKGQQNFDGTKSRPSLGIIYQKKEITRFFQTEAMATSGQNVLDSFYLV